MEVDRVAFNTNFELFGVAVVDDVTYGSYKLDGG